MDKLSICFVSQEYPNETGWGGIGTYTHEMAHALARQGHRVCVVTRALQKGRIYIEDDGVVVHRVAPRLSFNQLPMLWRLNRLWEGYHLAVAQRLYKLARNGKIDIVEGAALHGETALFQYREPRFPVVVRLHSCVPLVRRLNGAPTRLSTRKSDWLERRAIAMTHAITAPSHVVVRENMPFLPLKNKRVEVIPNSIDSDVFSPSGEHRTLGREDADLPAAATGPSVLFVGRLQPLKGAELLSRAMPLVWQRHSDAQVLFVGQDDAGPHGISTKAWILSHLAEERLGQVKFLGRVQREQLVALYRAAAVVVAPSYFESFGYTCLEGMSCGKTVIATCCGGPQEIIKDGKTGFLIPVGDPVRLAERITEALSDEVLREAVGRAARARVLACYDSRIVAVQTADFYRSVVGRS